MNRHERRKAQAQGQPIPVPLARTIPPDVLAGRYATVEALMVGEYVECVAMGATQALLYWGISPLREGELFRVSDVGPPDLPRRYLRGARKFRVTRK